MGIKNKLLHLHKQIKNKLIMAQSNSSGGIGFFGLLGIVFIILKLTGVIAWSWWWVLLPIYGGFTLIILLLIILWAIAYITYK